MKTFASKTGSVFISSHINLCSEGFYVVTLGVFHWLGGGYYLSLFSSSAEKVDEWLKNECQIALVDLFKRGFNPVLCTSLLSLLADTCPLEVGIGLQGQLCNVTRSGAAHG